MALDGSRGTWRPTAALAGTPEFKFAHPSKLAKFGDFLALDAHDKPSAEQLKPCVRDAVVVVVLAGLFSSPSPSHRIALHTRPTFSKRFSITHAFEISAQSANYAIGLPLAGAPTRENCKVLGRPQQSFCIVGEASLLSCGR